MLRVEFCICLIYNDIATPRVLNHFPALFTYSTYDLTYQIFHLYCLLLASPYLNTSSTREGIFAVFFTSVSLIPGRVLCIFSKYLLNEWMMISLIAPIDLPGQIACVYFLVLRLYFWIHSHFAFSIRPDWLDCWLLAKFLSFTISLTILPNSQQIAVPSINACHRGYWRFCFPGLSSIKLLQGSTAPSYPELGSSHGPCTWPSYGIAFCQYCQVPRLMDSYNLSINFLKSIAWVFTHFKHVFLWIFWDFHRLYFKMLEFSLSYVSVATCAVGIKGILR